MGIPQLATENGKANRQMLLAVRQRVGAGGRSIKNSFLIPKLLVYLLLWVSSRKR